VAFKLSLLFGVCIKFSFESLKSLELCNLLELRNSNNNFFFEFLFASSSLSEPLLLKKLFSQRSAKKELLIFKKKTRLETLIWK